MKVLFSERSFLTCRTVLLFFPPFSRLGRNSEIGLSLSPHIGFLFVKLVPCDQGRPGFPLVMRVC